MILNRELSQFFKRIMVATSTAKQAPEEAKYFQLLVDEERIIGVSTDGFRIVKAEIPHNQRVMPLLGLVYDAQMLPLLRDVFDNSLESELYIQEFEHFNSASISPSYLLSFEMNNKMGIELYEVDYDFTDWKAKVARYSFHRQFIFDKTYLVDEIRRAKAEEADALRVGDAVMMYETVRDAIPLCDEGDIQLNNVAVLASIMKQEPRREIGLAIVSSGFTYLAAPVQLKEGAKVYTIKEVE